jgi:hypothetical protein
MIYDMVLDSLNSVANRWNELAQSFTNLAEKLSAASEPIPADLGEVIEHLHDLDAMSQTEAGNIQFFAKNARYRRPALVLFTRAIEVLETSEKKLVRDVIPLFPSKDDLGGEYAHASIEHEAAVTQISRLRDSISQQLQEFEEVTTIQGERYVTRGIRDSMDNLTAYPVQTMGAEITPAPASPSGAGGTINLQKMVDAAMRNILGRLPRSRDTRSFLAALNQSFEIVDIEGHTVTVWKARAYAGQTELGGGVSGAQASLHLRAKASYDHAIPLLDSLYPLKNDFDEEETHASRMIIHNLLVELVNEMGVEGGPRVARVDGLFTALLGPEEDADEVGGQLAVLSEDLGLNIERVNTLEEETNLTNFTAFKDYIISLRDSWIHYRDHATDGKDLGTQLVLLSRALSVVAESVEEVLSAMDSVFVGNAERQVASYIHQGHQVLVGELFDWLSSFATDIAPEMIHDGGRRGVKVIIATTRQLEGMILGLIQAIPREYTLPKGMKHPRVMHALYELHGYLKTVGDKAVQVQLDVISGTSPSPAFSDETIDAGVSGATGRSTEPAFRSS